MSPSQFPEEPLTLSEEDGFGYFHAHIGMLLKDSRYQVLKKLGRGRNSTTWLVSDSQSNQIYHAIKIFTAHATKAHRDGNLLELEISQLIATVRMPPSRTPCFYDHFETDGPHGRHLCLVYRPLGQFVDSFRRSAPSQSLDPLKVQIIISNVLEALMYLHNADIIHTNIKAENVMFNEGADWRSVKGLLRKSPQEIYGLESYSFCLAGLSSARWVGKELPRRNTSEYALRAPEAILGADYGVKVDIWAVGCMAFELLTGRQLFHPEAGGTWSVEDDHLSQMMGLIGEDFTDKFLATCRKRNEYFDKIGKLLHTNQLPQMILELMMIKYGVRGVDAVNAGTFICSCLHLDPDKRPSARELLGHRWLESGADKLFSALSRQL